MELLRKGLDLSLLGDAELAEGGEVFSHVFGEEFELVFEGVLLGVIVVHAQVDSDLLHLVFNEGGFVLKIEDFGRSVLGDSAQLGQLT